MSKPENIEPLRQRAGEVSRLLKTLSHRNRLLVACDLMEGESSVNDIAERTGVRQPVLSRELSRLRAEGLVATRRESKMIFYRLADERLDSLVRALCDAFSEASPAAPPRRAALSRAKQSSTRKPRSGRPARSTKRQTP